MIVTVTLNPSIDYAMEIDALTRGAVIRASTARLDPGGKGVNVSRALAANGVPSRAVLPCGGDSGAQLLRLLGNERVDVIAVPITGSTRSNVTLAEPDGVITKINAAGPVLSTMEFEAVSQAVLAAADAESWVVISGSVPPELPIDAFAQLCKRAVAAGARLAVDTSGPALRTAAEEGASLLKPNREELAEAVGARLGTFGEVLVAADQLRSWGADTVLASLGADGAVLVDGGPGLAAEAPVSQRRSSVGAGDALLAGFLAGGARGEHALAEAVAWGAAAVSLPGSVMPGPADLSRNQVTVHRPDPDRPLLAND